MKKKLKTIFSPRNLIVWLLIVILLIAIPELTRPSMSQTEALVSMLCVEKKGEDIEVAVTVLTPGEERKVNNQVYTGSGKTLGEAIGNIGIMLGKVMGFAQCEVVAFGDNICMEGVVPSIDYMTRTKRVGRSAILINFSGEAKDFADAVSKLSLEKALRLDQILHYDQRYILSKNSNIDSFYKGYYSEISIGLMPQMKLETEDKNGAIEVASSGSGTSTNAGGQSSNSGGGQGEKKYIVNDGATCVFYKGVKRLELTPEQVKDLNVLQDNEQEGVLKVENVTDEIYNNATIVFALTKKNTKIKTKFENDKPIFEINVEVRVLVDEVIQENANKKFLRRNKEFLTSAAIGKLKETLKNKLMSTIEFCKENQIDVIGVYKNFNALNHNDFKKYYEKTKENYLNDIEYKVNVEINSAY